MKANERKLERLLKQIVQQQEVPAEELLFHWKGLDRKGDRIVIRTLNRHKGWVSFADWANRNNPARNELERLSTAAGAPEEAVEALQASGMVVSELDSPRTRSWWIRDAVSSEKRNEWPRARSMMMRDPDLLEGTLDLLEQSEQKASPEFITTLLEENPTHQQDHLIRTALYRLKQKGLELRPPGAKAFTEKEVFLFGENRMALWQPVLYSRAQSVFSDAGDLFVLGIEEGAHFEIHAQGTGPTGRHGVEEIAEKYSRNLEEQFGVKIPFRWLPSSVARYFLRKSLQLLEEGEAKKKFETFFNTAGEGQVEDPFSRLRELDTSQMPAIALFDHPYFATWFMDPKVIEGFLQESEKLESGPIILPEGQLRDRKHAIALEVMRSYFNERNRAVWAFAFEKAAFFLQERDAYYSQLSWQVSVTVGNREIPAESIPAISDLFERTVHSLSEQKKATQQEEKRGSVIMTPQEFERQQRKR